MVGVGAVTAVATIAAHDGIIEGMAAVAIGCNSGAGHSSVAPTKARGHTIVARHVALELIDTGEVDAEWVVLR